MYQAREQPDILKELQASSKTDAAKFEGTFEYDMLAANALEFSKVEIELEQAYKAIFAETSWGEYLTMRAAEFGVDRKEATKAVGTATIKGTAGSIIPLGSLFATESGVVFATTEKAVVPSGGAVDVPVEARTAGATGNVAAGVISKIPVNIPGIFSVSNAEATHDGFSEETDEALLKRLIIYVRTPATSGNIYHYQEWASSIPGVGSVLVVPLWNGNGTVKVYITDADNNAASEELQKKVLDYIETVRPIGAAVTVDTPDYLAVNVTANVKVAEGHEDIYKDEITKALNAYFISVGMDAGYVSIAQIGKCMLNSGAITDYDTLKINDGIANITLQTGYLPRLGTLEVSST